jgi:hypothetical protein
MIVLVPKAANDALLDKQTSELRQANEALSAEIKA